MIYQSGNLSVTTPYEMRMIRDDEFGDVDLYLDVKSNTVNLDMDFKDTGIVSRVQFPSTRAILIRYNKHENKNATVVILRNVDIQSQIVNFEIDYMNFEVVIEEKDGLVDFKLMRK